MESKDKIISDQLTAHLQKIESDTRAALDGFRASKRKLTAKFLQDFKQATHACVEQTCERYKAKPKPRVAPSQPIETQSTVTAKNSTDTKHGNETDEKPKKRQNEPEASTASTKKQRVSESSANDQRNDDKSDRHGDDSFSSNIFCAHCFDQNNPTASIHGSIEEVYDHWLAKHANESLSKPFKFYAFVSAGCFYCKFSGMYADLVKHHEDKHAGQQFAIIYLGDRDKCGICHSREEDVTNHFKVKHDANLLPKIFNPIEYSESSIDRLLKLNLPKKYQCKACKEISTTQAEMAAHFRNSHKEQVVQSKELVHLRSTPVHLICGYCTKRVDDAQFSSHFWDHSYDFNCTKCKYESNDMAEMIWHEKSVHKINPESSSQSQRFTSRMRKKFFNTAIVWQNGLTLNAFNVRGTKFDHSKSFDMFIHGFLRIMMQQAKKKIELNLSGAENRSTSHNESTTTTSSHPTPQKRAEATSTTVVNEPQPDTDSRSNVTVELNKQRELVNDIIVFGITKYHLDFNRQTPKDCFMNFARLMVGSHFAKDREIQSIIQLEYGIIVRFRRLEMKKLFICKTMGRFVLSNSLFLLPRNQTPWNIYAQNRMTPFYRNIRTIAQDLARNQRIHSVDLDENGFVIKLKANDRTTHIVQSKEQLMNLVKQGKDSSAN